MRDSAMGKPGQRGFSDRRIEKRSLTPFFAQLTILAILALVMAALFFGLAYALHPDLGGFGAETFRTREELAAAAAYLFASSIVCLLALGAAISGFIWQRIRERANLGALGALLVSTIVAWWKISDVFFRPL